VKVIIDGRFVLDEADLHRRLAGAFGYGPMYRHDLDSLTARLAAGDPRPVQLTWIHGSTIRMAIGTAAFEAFVTVFERIEAQDTGKEWPQRFVFRLFD
jgi:RNAse (barnase) inhibitor barstar